MRILINKTRTLYSHENRVEFNTKVYNYAWDLYTKNVERFILNKDE